MSFRPTAMRWLSRQLAASGCGGPDSIPGQSTSDLWCINRHGYKFFSRYFGFPLSVSFHHCSIVTFTLILLLSEAQTDEALALSKEAVLCRVSRGTEEESNVTFGLSSVSTQSHTAFPRLIGRAA